MTENPKSKIHTTLCSAQGTPKPIVFFWQRLRWNLTIASVILAVLPVVLVSFFTLTRLSKQAERQFTHQLEGIATLKQDQITRWLENSGYILDLIWAEEDHRQALIAVVAATLDPASSPDEAQLNHVNRLLAETAKAQALFEEFLLYNAQGRVIAASDPNQIGKILNHRPYFADSLVRNFIQPPYYEIGVEGITMFMTRPLSDSNGQAVGALAGRLDMKTLGQIMTERTGLGQTGETYLVSHESNYLVTPSRFAEQGYELTRAYHSEGIDRALNGENGNALYEDYRDPPIPVIGVYRWLPDLQVAFLAEIDQTEALAPFIETRNFSLSIAVVATLFALLVGLYTATHISRPVAELTRTARQIAAGDLTKQARISRLHEIGLLASAFNTMTLRLRGLINDLEQRFTELQQTQETLQASEARSRALIDGIPDMIFRITDEGLFLDFKAESTDLAMSAEEIIGSNLNDSPLPSPVIAELLRLTRLAIETNQLQTYEYELPMPSGLQIYETRVVKSGPNEVIHVVRNITKRTQMEKSLRESEERYARMVRGSSDGVWDWNILTGEDYLSPRWKEILGYEDKELPNVESSFFDLLHPDDKPRVNEAVERHFKEQAPYIMEVRLQHKDGSYRWVLTRGEAVRDDEDRPVRMAGSITDITERKQAEESLAKSEARLAEAQRIAHVGSWERNMQTNTAYWSDEHYWIFGLSPQKVAPSLETFLSFVHPDDRSLVHQSLQELSERRNPADMSTYRIIRPDGEIRVIDSRREVTFDEAGRLLRVAGIIQDVTERKQAEETLRTHSQILQAMAEGVNFVDTQDIIRYTNPAFDQMFGYEPGELLGQPISLLNALSPKENGHFIASILTTLQNGQTWEDEVTNRKKDGTVFYTYARISTMHQGDEAWSVTVQEDITERKQAEEALRKSEARLAEAQRIAHVGSWERNMQTDTAYWSEEHYRIFGLSPQEAPLPLKTFLNFVHPDDRSLVRQALQEFPEQRSPADAITYRIIRPDGEIRVIDSRREFTFDEAGRLLRVAGIIQDVTERKRVEEALRVSEHRFRAMVEQSPFSIVLYSPDGSPTKINQAFADLWQVSPDGISHLLANYNLLKDPHLKEQGLMPYIEKGFAGEFCQIPTIFYDPQQNPVTNPVVKNTLWIEGYIYPILNEDGQIDTVVLMHHDITKQSQAEEALRESEARLRRAESLTRIGHYALNIDRSNFVYSDGLKKIWGFEPASNPSFNDFVQQMHPDDQWAVAKLEQVAAEMRGYDFEFRVVHPDGTEVIVHSVAEISLAEPERLPRLFGTVMDITERKQAEEQIKAALYEKEALLKEIHHRVKNNMQIISSLLDLQADMIQDEQVRDLFKESQQRIRSMALIHERLYQSQNLAQIDFLEYVAGLTDYLLHSYGAMAGNITLDLDIAPLLLSIETAIPCGLIINELVSNAFKHAFPDGKSGKVLIRLSAIDHLLTLQIQDDGIGFPAELNPHHTESLGLTLVVTLVHQLKATIEMKNNNGVQIEIVFSDPTAKTGD